MATTPASVDKHPLHPILVALPIGLWIFSLVCDLVYRFGPHEEMWRQMAWYAIVAGLVGAVAAAVPGTIDFFSITDPLAGRVVLMHLVVNAGLVVLFALNAWLRSVLSPGSVLPLVLSIVGIAGLVVSGWLGGELVYVHRIGVRAGSMARREIRRGKRAA
jgi:uncharacterized membrane protein